MIGQLMRVHLAVPDGPIEAQIRPKVQPGPSSCPLFFPEAEDPITLSPGLWILRLPYPFLSVSVNQSRSQEKLPGWSRCCGIEWSAGR